MEEKILYISYDKFSVIYDVENHTFSVSYGKNKVIKNAQISVMKADDATVALTTFGDVSVNRVFNVENSVLTIGYSKSFEISEDMTIEFKLDNSGLLLTISGLRAYTALVNGKAYWGDDMKSDTFAMCINRSGFDLRCAYGPATSTVDNALYNRKTDSAVVIDGGKKIRFKYNWDEMCYDFCLETDHIEFQQRFKIQVKDNVIAQKYKIDFAPINKNVTFKKPPAGWMTWYAVKFNASEKTVLENVKFQEEQLKKYGADTIWIDWEWYHKDLEGKRNDGVDTFNPDNEKYPRGLKYVSGKIKEAGFIPSLWVGFTNDPAENDYAKENPEIVLKEQATWCGNYFYDFSHPKYLNEFLPKALQQVFDWGYEAVKFDTIPASLEYHDRFHLNMYSPELTTKEAFRGAMKKVREILGKDMYLLSCAAVKDQDLLWAADIFDAARVGNDIFEWEDYIKEGVLRTLKFYPMHNVVFYCDPDNVIMRDEFNTYNQAASRIYFVSLLGLPMTFGDDFKVLSNDRVELIKKCLPVMDIHPMDVNTLSQLPQVFVMNLNIELPFESYNIVNVFNTRGENGIIRVEFDKDLHLEKGEYHIFDFTKEKYIGVAEDCFEIECGEYESRILSVRKKKDVPQMLSTSRHITQGAAEITAMYYKNDTLHLMSNLVKNDEYKIALYIPEGYKITDSDGFAVINEDVTYLSFVPEETKEYKFEIKFN